MLTYINLIIFFILITLSLCGFFKRRKEEKEYASYVYIFRDDFVNQNKAHRKFFFCYDKEKKSNFFSEPFAKLLGIESCNADLTILRNIMNNEDYNKLHDLYNQLLNGNANIGVVNIALNNGALLNKHFECYSELTANHKAKAVGFIIWFKEVSFSTVENDKLKIELKKYKALFDKFPLACFERNGSYDIVNFNSEYSKLIAVDTESLIDTFSLEIDKQSRNSAESARLSNMVNVEEKYVIVDGSRQLYRIYEIPIDEESMFGVAINLSDKAKLQYELSTFLAAQSDLLESIASATAIFGADTRIQFYNQSYVKLWGLDVNFLVTKPTYGQILEELRIRRKLPEQADFQAFKAQQLKLFSELRGPNNEFYYLPDGKALRVLAIPYTLGGVLFAYEDMTDRLTLERSYNTLIAVQKATIDNLHEAVAVFGGDGCIKLYNHAYSAMWNFDSNFLDTGPHINQILDKVKHYFEEEEWLHLRDYLMDYVNNRKPTQKILERTDGMIINRVVVPLPDGASLVTNFDITDSMLVERSLREKNEALQAADKMKTEFLTNVSYELRSPLTTILGMSEALNRGLFGDLNKAQQEYMANIYTASLYLASLINDIIDLASVQAGHLKLNLDKIDIYALSNVIIEKVVTQNNTKQLCDIQFICDHSIGFILADAKRLEQVLYKIIMCALANNFKGNQLVFEVKEEDKQVIFSVKNSVFNFPFEKNHYTENDVHKSAMGISIALVKSFIDLHYAKIRIDNIGPQEETDIICIFDRENPKLLKEYEQRDNKKLDNKI